MADTLLKVDNINVYYGNIHAVKGISFEVNQGEIVTLIGANGAGKSTTLRTISGLVKADSGSITYNGEELLGKPINKVLEAGIAQSPEGRRVFPNLTVLENLKSFLSQLFFLPRYASLMDSSLRSSWPVPNLVMLPVSST